MKYPILGLAICMLIAGCEKFDTKTPEQDPLTRKTLSGAEQALKENLQKAARIISDIVQDDAVLSEIKAISDESRSFYNLSFRDLLSESKGTGELFPLLRERFLNECEGSQSKGQVNDLAAFLAGNDCYIYCPYPMSFYPKGISGLTVASHPIDNDIKGPGYRYDGKSLVAVTVDEAYADKYPVLLIMPKDEDKDDLSGMVKVDPATAKGDPVYEVRVGKVRCADYCGGLFEGDLELRIVRGFPDYNLSTGAIGGGISTAIPIDYPRSYAKAAINGWTVHSNGGWYTLYMVWDSNWRTTKTLQCILVYEYDTVKESTVSATVSYKKDNLTPSTTVSVKMSYSGDFLGLAEWDRDWFFATNSKPGPYDEVKDGWTVRKTCQEFKLTTPLTIY
jgi:hypothetical protein